jgi:hypothetical protein
VDDEQERAGHQAESCCAWESKSGGARWSGVQFRTLPTRTTTEMICAMPFGLRRSALLVIVLVAALVCGACGARPPAEGAAGASLPRALSASDRMAKAVAEGGSDLVRAVYSSLQTEHVVAVDRVRCSPFTRVLSRCSTRVTMTTLAGVTVTTSSLPLTVKHLNGHIYAVGAANPMSTAQDDAGVCAGAPRAPLCTPGDVQVANGQVQRK